MKSYTSRRSFLKHGAVLGSVISAPRPLMALLGERPEPVPPIEDKRLRELASAGIDAAIGAGASYTDVRLTHTFSFDLYPLAAVDERDREEITIGIRALVNGYWGFASSTVWSREEAVRLGEEAARQAKTNADWLPYSFEVPPVTETLEGHWTMPVKEDPFQISRDEVYDYIGGLEEFTNEYGTKHFRHKHNMGSFTRGFHASFWKQERAFASSDGHFFTQRLYRSTADIRIAMGTMLQSLDGLTPAGLGFEYLRDQPLRDRIAQQLHDMDETISLPVKPHDVGRYDMLFDQSTVAKLVGQTVGTATEVDRVMGYEANAGGTSYISDPDETLGTFSMGSETLNILGDRTSPGGAATVAWDDDGVPTREFPILQNGVFVNLQTSREGAGWIRDALSAAGQPFQSTACASSPDASFLPVIHSANLKLQPGSGEGTIESTIEQMESGIFLKGGTLEMDFQQISGYGSGLAYEIKDGKKTAVYPTAAILFRTPEIWKSVVHTGGESSTRRFGFNSKKGEPAQESYYSVSSPHMLCKDITVIDRGRKA